MIKAVICDLGNVLAFFDRSVTYKKLARRLNISTREIQEKFENAGIMEQYELGRITSEEFHTHFLKIIGKPGAMQFEEFANIYSDMFTPNSSFIQVLQELENKTLVMLSNTCEIHFEHIRKNFPEITNLFGQRLVLSYREGKAKPHPDSFAKALELAESKPCQALFIDDISRYTRAAAELGLHTFTYWPGAVISPEVFDHLQCHCSQDNSN